MWIGAGPPADVHQTGKGCAHGCAHSHCERKVGCAARAGGRAGRGVVTIWAVLAHERVALLAVFCATERKGHLASILCAVREMSAAEGAGSLSRATRIDRAGKRASAARLATGRTRGRRGCWCGRHAVALLIATATLTALLRRRRVQRTPRRVPVHARFAAWIAPARKHTWLRRG